jgi:hypothetical protein
MPFALEQLTQGLSVAAQISPQNLTQNTSVNSGNGIDMSKFRRAMAVIQVGAGGGNITAKLQAATTSGGAFSDVAGSTITAITTTNKQATIEVRDDELQTLVGAGYQWLRLVITENNVAATQVSGLLLGGEGDWKPASKQDPASVVQRLVV